MVEDDAEGRSWRMLETVSCFVIDQDGYLQAMSEVGAKRIWKRDARGKTNARLMLRLQRRTQETMLMNIWIRNRRCEDIEAKVVLRQSCWFRSCQSKVFWSRTRL